MTELRARTWDPKTAKFRNIKTELDGYTFDSKAEARCYADLRNRERAGEIDRLQVHPKYVLSVDGTKVCTFIPDFQFVDKRASKSRVIDVKSPSTAALPAFRLKCKLLKAIHKIEVEIWPSGKEPS